MSGRILTRKHRGLEILEGEVLIMNSISLIAIGLAKTCISYWVHCGNLCFQGISVVKFLCRIVDSILLLSFWCLPDLEWHPHVSFLPLVINVFSLFFLLEVCQLYWSFQNTSSLFHSFLYWISLISASPLLFPSFCCFWD